MNKHILLVMKWLDDKDSVSQEELEENKRISVAAYWADAADAYAACAAADAAYAADYAACAADYAACAAADYAAYWVNKYFKETGEDKNEYVKELEK